ncbi:hypothetical protein UPYG_G00269560 [Umbra pygmaea]|uniref:Kit ligand n=1 Tax=Umbra pygmaea TaxID=75934 RepID=A0ABD0WFI2_UMBPY
MKKPKIWIHICVHLLLCIITLGHSREFGNPVTDDFTSISLLKQNIPKDYKIPFKYIPKEVGGMCWVELNIFNLELSLQELAEKFGNISSNKYNITILIAVLKDKRFALKNLETVMNDFECHYLEEKWETGRYFHYVENILKMYNSNKDSPNDCDPPPCPTTAMTETTTMLPYSISDSVSLPECDISGPDCTRNERRTFLPEVVEKSLLSLLVVPIVATVFLVMWKVRSRRNQALSDEHSNVEGGLFTGNEGNLAPPLEETSEKNRLNIIETV